MSIKNYFAKLLFSTLLLCSNLSHGQNRYYWYYTIVDNNGRVGTYTALQLDKQDRPMIAYCRVNSFLGGLKFASFDGSQWTTSFVDPQYGFDSDLALDSQSRPHISYSSGTAVYQLRYATYDGRNWNRRILDNYGELGFDTSIGVDKNDRVHIGYWVEFHGDGPFQLKQLYAYFDGQNWKVHTRIDSVDNNGKWSDLAFDSQQRPHLSYVSSTFGNLRHAYLDKNIWRTEDVEERDGAISQGWNNAIDIDPDDVIRLSFIDESNRRLKYARGTYGNWAIELVDTVLTYTGSSRTSVKTDKNKSPIIAYHDARTRNLKIAYKANTSWRKEVVDSVGFVGEYCSLQLDSNDLPVISYYDSTRGHLKIAHASLTPPPDQDRDSVPDYLETAFLTDPSDADSDDDGLSDGEEDINQNGLVENYETNPRNADSDSDGIPDGMERGRASGVAPPQGMKGTDPARFHADADPSTKTNPLLPDTDGDRLNDGDEDGNRDGRVDVDEPDPNNRDTDADGLADGVEVRLGMSPIDVDSDDDGLADRSEDKNLNGALDADETNPATADTDDDGLEDGLELGVTAPVADPDGAGKLRATDLAKFVRDADPATKTNPRLADTDMDRFKDGEEDKNHNGRLDNGETNPLNADTDGDKLTDGNELLAGTNPLDLDSDDDGIEDGAEDANLNGQQDDGEISPAHFDSDDDGVSDGVERGVTAGIPDPDGNGPLLGTAAASFIADADPAVNSNPLLWDTDMDGLADGEEDVNRNGAANAGETHFLKADTDGDGFSDGDEKSFGSNPLDPKSQAALTLLFKDNFQTGGLQGWTIVDEGHLEAPSDWFTQGEALLQTSNIWDEIDAANPADPNKRGTFIWAQKFAAQNYKVSFTMRSIDDDELGVMFHYRDRDNYYRFAMNRGQRYRQLIKRVAGQASVIVTETFAYEPERDYAVTILAANGKIQVYVDQRVVFNSRDNTFSQGSIAFYCWKNAGALFKNISITGQNPSVAVEETPSEVIRNFALSAAYPNPTAAVSIFTLQLPQLAVIRYEIFDVLGRSVLSTPAEIHERGRRQLLWDGRDERGQRAPAGIYFIQIEATSLGQSKQILWKTIQKIVRIK